MGDLNGTKSLGGSYMDVSTPLKTALNFEVKSFSPQFLFMAVCKFYGVCMELYPCI